VSQAEELVQKFIAGCESYLPGLLVLTDLADAKRRNCHLGYQVVDQDIEEFDRMLQEFTGSSGLSCQVRGSTWLSVLPQTRLTELQQLLLRFQKNQIIQVGWKCRGIRNCDKSRAERSVRATITRGIKSLYVEVMDQKTLDGLIDELLDQYYKVEPGEAQALDSVRGQASSLWCCVSDYPDEDPFCPFCDGTRFDWDDGDDSVYSGSGTCLTCSAYVSISSIEELEE